MTINKIQMGVNVYYVNQENLSVRKILVSLRDIYSSLKRD